MEKRKDLIVAALENGTVIDHIPTSKLFKVVQMLELDKSNDSVTIGNNYSSKLLGRKGLIKVADRYFSDDEISRLAVVCPNIQLCIIRDYEVVEKKVVCLPDKCCKMCKPSLHYKQRTDENCILCKRQDRRYSKMSLLRKRAMY